jgi:hypothetical protein
MRALLILGLCILLGDCGISRQAVEEEAEPATLTLTDTLAACRNGYPDQITQAVARAACVIKATALMRAALPFPELRISQKRDSGFAN